MGGEGAAVGNDGGGAAEQGCPGGGGCLGNEHVAGREGGEVVGALDDAYRAGGPAGGGRVAGDECFGADRRSACVLDGAVDDVADEAGWPAEGQGRGEPALVVPLFASLSNV